MNPEGGGAVIPPGAGRGLRIHLEAGDLDAMDGLRAEDFGLAGFPDEPLFLQANMAARIGLNETALTRAMAAGRFDQAEEIILERGGNVGAGGGPGAGGGDPDYLNDGAHAATPLMLALTGRSGSYQPRHLRLARLLVERGASVNLRIPNHDLETASESPLELLTSFYLSLIKVFGENGEGRRVPITAAQ